MHHYCLVSGFYMYKKFTLLLLVGMLVATYSNAQTENDTIEIKKWLMGHISALADTSMHGRGYVKNGRGMAAEYIKKEFKKYNLQPAGRKKTFVQSYSFPVNSFPGRMELTVNGTTLAPGKDYIVDASSHSFSGNNLVFEKKDLSGIRGNEDWQKVIKSFKTPGKVYLLENVDSACKKLGIRKHFLPYLLPKGCYIIPQTDKFIWTVECENSESTVFYVKEDALPATIKTLNVQVQAEFINDAESQNLVATLPGEVKDTFLAITAHYDHLGMMGSNAIFTGASDNASGTAMLLYLANYFSTHPHHYSLLFISFSGEEAGLLGSEYFIRHPRVPLKNIKLLTNIDIMGDASEGITVVNATEYPNQFNQLLDINNRFNYLPQVKSRGKAANSDHYFFSEKGVPSFFIYSNGGKGHYHDIFDTADEVSLNHIGSIAHLLIDFLKEIK